MKRKEGRMSSVNYINIFRNAFALHTISVYFIIDCNGTNNANEMKILVCRCMRTKCQWQCQ